MLTYNVNYCYNIKQMLDSGFITDSKCNRIFQKKLFKEFLSTFFDLFEMFCFQKYFNINNIQVQKQIKREVVIMLKEKNISWH